MIADPQNYIEWMKKRLIGYYPPPGIDYYKYTKLFLKLYLIPFSSIKKLDRNRESDAFRLRYQFGIECHIPSAAISKNLDIAPATFLEIMVSLAQRLHHNLTLGMGREFNTSGIFWMMVENMGLIDQTDDEFNEKLIEEAAARVSNYDISENGEGGFFAVSKDRNINMRACTDIWDMAMKWLSSVQDWYSLITPLV